jgi:cold shock CspA family protein
MTGYIKFFDVRKRIGYIVPNGVTREDKDKHVFFHEAEMEGGGARGGEIVEFSLNPNYPNPIYKTRRAASIRVLSKSAVPIDQQRKAVASGD